MSDFGDGCSVMLLIASEVRLMLCEECILADDTIVVQRAKTINITCMAIRMLVTEDNYSLLILAEYIVQFQSGTQKILVVRSNSN